MKVNVVQEGEEVPTKSAAKAIKDGKAVRGWFDRDTGEVQHAMLSQGYPTEKGISGCRDVCQRTWSLRVAVAVRTM